MSRKPPGSQDAIESASNASDNICPVCKQNRYWAKEMKFLINPECYHKMCSGCVDRLFTSGPGTCPIVGCNRTLRKKNFKEAFFADLTIQRSADIRKKVAAVFNRKEDDFETLRDWNDYLEMVENLTFDLTDGNEKERAAAEEKLKMYSQGHKGEIEENRRLDERMRNAEKERERRELADAKERRLNAALMQEEEKLELEKSKRDVLEQLANSDGEANAIAQQAQRIILKKSSARRSAMANTNANIDFRANEKLFTGSDREGTATSGGNDGFAIRGLKKKAAPVIEGPYDPFGGVKLKPTMFVLQNDYDHEWLNEARNNQSHTAGGYSLHEFYSRTMFEAFSGLAVFIEDEANRREEAASNLDTEMPKLADAMDMDPF